MPDEPGWVDELASLGARRAAYERYVHDSGIVWPESGEGIPGYHRVAEDAFMAGWDACRRYALTPHEERP